MSDKREFPFVAIRAKLKFFNIAYKYLSSLFRLRLQSFLSKLTSVL